MTEQDYEEWEWDFPAQLYKHKPCDTHVPEGTAFCAKCDKQCPAIRTLGDLQDFVERHDFQRDEYFSLWEYRDHKFYERKDVRRWLLWTRDTRWVAAYWVVGGSEGYYLHIDGILSGDSEKERQILAVGKFWDWERAEFAVQVLQRWINGEQDTPVKFEKVPPAKQDYRSAYRCVACHAVVEPGDPDYYDVHAHGPCPLSSCPTNCKEN